jgi:hypothetical protein
MRDEQAVFASDERGKRQTTYDEPGAIRSVRAEAETAPGSGSRVLLPIPIDSQPTTVPPREEPLDRLAVLTELATTHCPAPYERRLDPPVVGRADRRPHVS